MKKLLSKFLIASLIFSAFLIFNPSVAQAGGSIYLSPGGQSVSQGSTFYVSVRVNTGGSSVDAVQANVSYPADKLDYLGVGYGGTGFEIQAESSGGGGSVRMGRGTLSAKSGDQLIGTITFKAKVSSGSAWVGFTSGSEAVKGGSVVVSATSGATYTFTTPPPPPKPKPKDKTAPKISDVKVVNIGLDTATITWKTNEKATSIVEYGPSKKLGIIASSTKLITTHKIALSSKLLFPGTQFYYQVKSKDAAGNEAKSKLTSFKTKGYKIKLKILGSDGKPLAGVKVTLVPGMEEATTDESGLVTFTDIAPGKLSVNVKVGEQVLAAQIEVSESKKPDETQDIQVKVAGVSGSKVLIEGVATYAAVFFLGLLIAFTAVFLVWWKKRKGQVKPSQAH
ncbi:MAG TPA: hypothetical protein VF303_04020 [Candidatus Nanoarchaeia archaeon]